MNLDSEESWPIRVRFYVTGRYDGSDQFGPLILFEGIKSAEEFVVAILEAGLYNEADIWDYTNGYDNDRIYRVTNETVTKAIIRKLDINDETS